MEVILRKQKNCKICSSPDCLIKSFTLLLHVHHYTYKQLIEVFRCNGIELNSYNCSVHAHRHLTEDDFEQAEKDQAKWDKEERETQAEKN